MATLDLLAVKTDQASQFSRESSSQNTYDNDSSATAGTVISREASLHHNNETDMELQAMTNNSTERYHTDKDSVTVQQERKKSIGNIRVYKLLEGLLLTAIVLVLCVIYSTPTIFFVNPPLDFIQVSLFDR